MGSFRSLLKLQSEGREGIGDLEVELTRSRDVWRERDPYHLPHSFARGTPPPTPCEEVLWFQQLTVGEGAPSVSVHWTYAQGVS